MTSEEFIRISKTLIRDYTNKHVINSHQEQISTSDVYIMHVSNVFNNWSAIVSTTFSGGEFPNGMLYTVLLDGDRNECYLYAYKQFEDCATIVHLKD